MTIDLNVLALNCFVLQSADFTDLISVSASGSTLDVCVLLEMFRGAKSMLDWFTLEFV